MEEEKEAYPLWDHLEKMGLLKASLLFVSICTIEGVIAVLLVYLFTGHK